MATEDLTIEEKCENLMNVVVESRKRFGKMCVDYDQKASLMENKMLNLQMETTSNYRFKSKHPVPSVDVNAMCKVTDDYMSQTLERKKKIEKLKKDVENTRQIVLQLKQDTLGRKMNHPVTLEIMLSRAKARLSKDTKDVEL